MRVCVVVPCTRVFVCMSNCTKMPEGVVGSGLCFPIWSPAPGAQTTWVAVTFLRGHHRVVAGPAVSPEEAGSEWGPLKCLLSFKCLWCQARGALKIGFGGCGRVIFQVSRQRYRRSPQAPHEIWVRAPRSLWPSVEHLEFRVLCTWPWGLDKRFLGAPVFPPMQSSVSTPPTPVHAGVKRRC